MDIKINTFDSTGQGSLKLYRRHCLVLSLAWYHTWEHLRSGVFCFPELLILSYFLEFCASTTGKVSVSFLAYSYDECTEAFHLENCTL